MSVYWDNRNRRFGFQGQEVEVSFKEHHEHMKNFRQAHPVSCEYYTPRITNLESLVTVKTVALNRFTRN